MVKKVLITGFEPFGGAERNPSHDAVSALPPIENAEIKKLFLPVVWDKATTILENEIDAFSPDVVILSGLAGGSKCIRIERVGINLRGAVRDNEGLFPSHSDIPTEAPCISGGDAAYFSTFDFAAIKDAVSELDIPVSYSFSAGTYLCNNVLYIALRKNAIEKRNMQIGFIHLPYESCDSIGRDVFSLPLSDMVKALHRIVSVCILPKAETNPTKKG